MDQPTQEAQPPVPNPPIQPPASSGRGVINPGNLFRPNNSQNFMEVRSVMIGERPSGYWKSVVVDIFAVILAALFGYSFWRYLNGNLSFWFVFVALLLWGSVSVIEGFLQKSFSRRFSILVLESLALVGFFYSYAWEALLITAVLALIVLTWGYLSVRREIQNGIEIRFFTASGKVIGKVITAAVIFMVVMYASLANDRGNFFVSEQGFSTFFTWASGFVNSFYPTVPLTGSFGDFAQAVARMQLQGNPAFQSLTAAEQDAALGQAANQIMMSFSPSASSASSTAASTTAAEPTSNVLYSYLAALMAKLQDKFSTGFIGFWGLALFLILRSIGIIVVWIAQFVALMFYELLLATRFIRISESATTREELGY